MKKLLAVCATIGVAFIALPSPASAQCTYTMNDVGRFHGYLSGPCNGAALGYAGAYRSHYNTAAGANPTANTPKPAPQVNGHAGVHRYCDETCARKCERTWVLLGFKSVGHCIARWHKLNVAGTAHACEQAIVASGYRRIQGC